MGVFDEIKQNQKPKEKEPVIKAIKTLKKGYLMGCISNGDAIIRLNDEYAIKTIALDNQFVKLVLVDYGKNLIMPKQGWQKTKTVEKQIGNRIKKIDEQLVEEEDLF